MCERLGNCSSHKQRWKQPRLSRTRDEVDVLQGHLSILEYFLEYLENRICMESSSDLWDNSLSFVVFLELSFRTHRDELRTFKQGHRSIITRGLECEKIHYFSIIKSILSGLEETCVSQNGERRIFTFAILLSLRRIDVAASVESPAMRFLSFLVRLLLESSKLYEIVAERSVVPLSMN